MAASPDGDEVTCIACGTALGREDAHEYDKYGDHHRRDDRSVEYLCRGCYERLTHQPRNGLESLLETIEDETDDRESFLSAYRWYLERESAGESAE